MTWNLQNAICIQWKNEGGGKIQIFKYTQVIAFAWWLHIFCSVLRINEKIITWMYNVLIIWIKIIYYMTYIFNMFLIISILQQQQHSPRYHITVCPTLPWQCKKQKHVNNKQPFQVPKHLNSFSIFSWGSVLLLDFSDPSTLSFCIY